MTSRWWAGWPLALLAVVVAGAALRLWAFGGVSFAHNSDDGRYAEVARNLSTGHAPEGDAEWFGFRITFLWPVALLFRVAGASDYTAVAWPLVGSLAAVAVAGLIGREIGGDRVGIIAACLVAAAPLEVIMGTRLRPDPLMPAFVGFAVWSALRAARSPRRTLLWAAAAGAALGAGWFVRESIFVMAPVVALAGRRAGLPGLAAGIGGAVAMAGLAAGLGLAAGASAGRPFVAAPAETIWRDPLAVWSWPDSYLARAVAGAFDPGHPLFLLLPALAIAAVATAVPGRRRALGGAGALLVATWVAWSALYLELGVLVNLDKPLRFLTLASIPVALALALAVARLPRAVAAGLVVMALAASLAATDRLAAAEARGQDVVLLNQVVAELRAREPAPVLAESFVWHRKLETWLARDRLTVAAVVDPGLLQPRERRLRRRLDPLPDPARYRGGWVVSAPVSARRGWPSNWGVYRRELRRRVPWSLLEIEAVVGRATIYRWPADVPPAD